MLHISVPNSAHAFDGFLSMSCLMYLIPFNELDDVYWCIILWLLNLISLNKLAFGDALLHMLLNLISLNKLAFGDALLHMTYHTLALWFHSMSLQLATLRFKCSGLVTQARDLADKRVSTQSDTIAMSISFATLLAQCGVPNAGGLTESSPVGAWTFLFNRKASVIDFASLSTTGWDYPGCSGGCGSPGCNNNFCTAQAGVPWW